MVWIAAAGLPDLLKRRRGPATLWMVRLYGGSSGFPSPTNLFGSKPRRCTTAASSSALFYCPCGRSFAVGNDHATPRCIPNYEYVKTRRKHPAAFNDLYSGLHACFRSAHSRHDPTAAGTSIDDSYYHECFSTQHFSPNSSHHDDVPCGDISDSCLYHCNTSSHHDSPLFACIYRASSNRYVQHSHEHRYVHHCRPYSVKEQFLLEAIRIEIQCKCPPVSCCRQAKKQRRQIRWLCNRSCFLPDSDIQFLLRLPQASKICEEAAPRLDIHRSQTFRRPEYSTKALYDSGSHAQCLEPIVRRVCTVQYPTNLPRTGVSGRQPAAAPRSAPPCARNFSVTSARPTLAAHAVDDEILYPRG
ncbi:hypothetical protein C8R44DRAFT_812853 [Mycena epipterygia]|nr:hypothetical protein C8R44DRAFT_812853 [Mycena epipterygia]